jgi:hypothetical protein
VQTEVGKSIPSTGVFGFGNHSGIGDNASHTEFRQQIFRVTTEPTLVSWFENNVVIVQFAKQCKESSCTASIKLKTGRKLKQDGAEFLP